MDVKKLYFWKSPDFAAKSRTEKFLTVFPWMWLVAAYCSTVAFLWFKCRGIIDSDMASEMVLADLLNEEGDLLLSQNWWYSTEIRVFYLQLFYRLGLLLFPHDWFAARVFGQALWLAALIAAYLYVGHGLHLRGCGVWGAAALMCPFGACYLGLAILGGYYIPHMILVLLSLGLALRVSSAREAVPSRLISIMFLSIICLLSGLNGVKGIMGFYLPQCAAAIALFLLRWMHAPQSPAPKTEQRYIFIAFFSLFTASVGYLVNSKVLAARYTFNNFNDTSWGEFSLTKLLDVWGGFLSLLGYPRVGAWQVPIKLFSVKGVLGCCGLVLAAAFLVALAMSVRKLPFLSPTKAVAPALMLCILVIQGSIGALTTSGSDNSYGTWNLNHWTTVLPFAFFLVQVWLEQTDFCLPHLRTLITGLLTACVVGASVCGVKVYLDSSLFSLPGLEDICDWLTEQGYTQGYASYWNGPVLTEWSSGQIEVWVPNSWYDLAANEWLQQTSHTNPPEGEVFLLSTTWEMESNGISALRDSENVVYDDDRFVVVLYSDFDALQTAVSSAQSNASEQGSA